MTTDYFETIKTFPDPEALERYASLVGLDKIKERLEKEAEIMLRPDLLAEWSNKVHGSKLPALEMLQRRPPLFVFAGDVGTGKTGAFDDILATILLVQQNQSGLVFA